MINILIADNQSLTQAGLKSILENLPGIKIVGNAGTPTELEQLILKLRPRVVIIDPAYDHSFSLTDVAYFHSAFDFIRILVLSNRQAKKQILDVIDTGVRNYIFKECDSDELVRAIYGTAKGEQFFCKNTFEVLFGNKFLPQKDDSIPVLSVRETEIVHLVAEGLTNKLIADRLFLSVHTVKSHRKNIIKKLGFTFKNIAEFASLIQH